MMAKTLPMVAFLLAWELFRTAIRKFFWCGFSGATKLERELIPFLLGQNRPGWIKRARPAPHHRPVGVYPGTRLQNGAGLKPAQANNHAGMQAIREQRDRWTISASQWICKNQCGDDGGTAAPCACHDRDLGSADAWGWSMTKRVFVFNQNVPKNMAERVASRQKDRPLPKLKQAKGIEPLLLPLVELAYDQCRYPFRDSDYKFCGLSKLSSNPYCGPHMAITRVPKVPKSLTFPSSMAA
jgi:hypothetical protein